MTGHLRKPPAVTMLKRFVAKNPHKNKPPNSDLFIDLYLQNCSWETFSCRKLVAAGSHLTKN